MKCNNCGGEWNPPKNISLTICPFCNMPVIEDNTGSKFSQPYEVVRYIVEQYGQDIFLDNKKLSALLMDLMTEKTKERNILGIAIQAGIANKILATKNSDIRHRELIFAQCEMFLSEDYGMSEQWASFAVNCFVYALGWIKTINTELNKVSTTIKPYNISKANPYNTTNTIDKKTRASPIRTLKEIVFSNVEPNFEDTIAAVSREMETNNNDKINKDSIASKIFKKYQDLKNTAVSNNSSALGLTNINHLTSNTIPNTVTSIDYRAFENNKNLINIIIPNSVTSIAPEAFIGCKNLKSITIPNSVVSIGDGAFKGCVNLTNINIDKKNAKYSTNNGMLFSYDKTKLISYPSAIIANIPEGVIYIGNNAFAGCENMTSIIIPKSVTSIEYNAFWGCVNLKNIIIDKKNIPYSSTRGMLFDYYKTKLISYPSAVTVDIPKSVTHIGYGTFGGCKNLTSIIIPDNISSIGNYAFEGCINLKSIAIPNRLNFIGDSAFDGCVNLTNIIIDKKNMRYSSRDGILFNYDKTSLLSYPSATETNIPSSVSHIGDGAFLGCKNLSSVTMSNSVTSIGYMAFAGCENLMSITIPSSVTSIGNYAFLNCDKLIVTCNYNSYAQRYCIDNNIEVQTKNRFGANSY